MLKILANVFFCFIIIAKEIFILKHYFDFLQLFSPKKLNHCVFLGGEFWFFLRRPFMEEKKNRHTRIPFLKPLLTKIEYCKLQ